MIERLSRAEDPTEAHERAAAALRSGSLVIVPTDTVYAVVCDAFQPRATTRLLGVKGRGREAPLTVLVRSPRQVSGLTVGVDEPAERLMASYWPGPLTLILALAEGLTWDLGDARGSVAIRMPADGGLTDLVGDVGPLAASGTTPADQPVAADLDEVVARFADHAALIVDDGPRDGLPSTVVDCRDGGARVLRIGAVPADHVRQVAEGVVSWGHRPAEVTGQEG